jgi:hypothetical protein
MTIDKCDLLGDKEIIKVVMKDQKTIFYKSVQS